MIAFSASFNKANPKFQKPSLAYDLLLKMNFSRVYASITPDLPYF